MMRQTFKPFTLTLAILAAVTLVAAVPTALGQQTEEVEVTVEQQEQAADTQESATLSHDDGAPQPTTPETPRAPQPAEPLADDAARTDVEADVPPVPQVSPADPQQPSPMLQPQLDLNAPQDSAAVESDVDVEKALDGKLGIEFNFNQSQQGQVQRGLAIRTITPNSIFGNSGLRQGDVLISINGRPILDRAGLVRLVTEFRENRIPLVVRRDNREQTIYLDRPAGLSIVRRGMNSASQAVLGVTLDHQFTDAAIIKSLAPNGPAEQAGLKPGDMITAINEHPVSSANDVVKKIKTMQPGEQVVVDYSREQEPNRAEAVLVARSDSVRYTVGYPPEEDSSNQGRMNDNDRRRIRPGDPDGDGRRLDGDGRLPRRIYRNR